jgi:pyridoxal phosphate enzyme (YggS family)
VLENLSDIKQNISAAAIRAGNDPAGVILVAVTKTLSADTVKAALDGGLTEIGESRVQEAQEKFQQLAGLPFKKHFLGHLQTNKAKKAVELFDMIQSLDSVRLADEINRQAERLHKIQDCLIEVKISSEATKSGLEPENLDKLLAYCSKNLANVSVKGLMALAPLTETAEESRQYFKAASRLFNEARTAYPAMKILSMGMSDDYAIAVEEGSTMVRIGSALFGKR